MSEEKSLIVRKENIFNKLINFFKNLFAKKSSKPEENIQNHIIQEKDSKNNFIKELRQSTEDENLVEQIRKDKSLLENMSIEALDNVIRAIKNRQQLVNEKIAIANQEILMNIKK